PDVTVVSERDAPTPESARSEARVVLYHFETNLGRKSLYDFPGWHRSFAFGALYAQANGFQRVIHLESDAHLTSARIQRHFNQISEGWIALWAHKYQMPELAIQVAAGSGLQAYADFARRPYQEMVGRSHEQIPPYTHVEQHFTGDRYGEHLLDIPRGADYA